MGRYLEYRPYTIYIRALGSCGVMGACWLSGTRFSGVLSSSTGVLPGTFLQDIIAEMRLGHSL